MMGVARNTGFTIIELMLFLAITGLMMIGIFAAANNGINNQRYSSAVTSLLSYFQDQYNSTVNVRNDRATSQQCTAAGVGGGSAQPVVGTSVCSVIGRFITIDAAGQTLTSSPVYATGDISRLSVSCQASDVRAFSCLNLVTDTSQSSTYALQWDTRALAKAPASGVISSLGIFMYRSPLSGQIGVMWSTTPPATASVASLLASPQSGPFTMCVDQTGWTTIPRMGVTIDTTTVGSSNAISRVAGGGGC